MAHDMNRRLFLRALPCLAAAPVLAPLVRRAPALPRVLTGSMVQQLQLREAQQLLNYVLSAEVEMLSIMPRSPWVLPAEFLE